MYMYIEIYFNTNKNGIDNKNKIYLLIIFIYITKDFVYLCKQKKINLREFIFIHFYESIFIFSYKNNDDKKKMNFKIIYSVYDSKCY